MPPCELSAVQAGFKEASLRMKMTFDSLDQSRRQLIEQNDLLRQHNELLREFHKGLCNDVSSLGVVDTLPGAP
eukprot:6209223-Pleurochrysis_carterae.AAC.11